jgi:hypothetical protein
LNTPFFVQTSISGEKERIKKEVRRDGEEA